MIKNINVDELRDLLAKEKFNLLDVREVHEYIGGHIDLAVNVPLSQLPILAGELDRGKTYHIICGSGIRSMKACAFLEQEGISTVNVEGGMKAWQGVTL